MQIIIIAFLLYLLYRFVTGFLLPVLKTAGHVKQQFNAMKDQMNGQQSSYESTSNTHATSQANALKKWSTSGRKGSKEDYIDYEEIK
jgi:hypothetical protein